MKAWERGIRPIRLYVAAEVAVHTEVLALPDAVGAPPADGFEADIHPSYELAQEGLEGHGHVHLPLVLRVPILVLHERGIGAFRLGFALYHWDGFELRHCQHDGERPLNCQTSHAKSDPDMCQSRSRVHRIDTLLPLMPRCPRDGSLQTMPRHQPSTPSGNSAWRRPGYRRSRRPRWTRCRPRRGPS